MALTSARWRLTDISSIRTPQISRHLPKSFPPLVGISTRLPSGSTPEVLRIRPTWTRYGKGWMRYGSYKDTSYQVNAESGYRLYLQPGKDGRKTACILLWLHRRNCGYRIFLDPPPCHRQGNEPGSPSNPSLSAWGGYAETGP